MSEQIEKIIEDLRTNLEKIGVYVEQIQIASDIEPPEDEEKERDVIGNMRQLIQEKNANFFIMTQARVNEVAFSDRVLYPDKFKQDIEFKTVMPKETNLEIGRLRELMDAGHSYTEAMRLIKEEEGEA